MPFIEWDNSFLLGIKHLDEHHRHLVGLLNDIYDDYTTEAPSKTLGKALDGLIDYASYHFTAEEQWMDEQSYYKLDEHREEHDRFANKIKELQKGYYENKLNISLEVLIFLKNWLTEHILTVDRESAQYIAAKNEVISHL